MRILSAQREIEGMHMHLSVESETEGSPKRSIFCLGKVTQMVNRNTLRQNHFFCTLRSIGGAYKHSSHYLHKAKSFVLDVRTLNLLSAEG